MDHFIPHSLLHLHAAPITLPFWFFKTLARPPPFVSSLHNLSRLNSFMAILLRYLHSRYCLPTTSSLVCISSSEDHIFQSRAFEKVNWSVVYVKSNRFLLYWTQSRRTSSDMQPTSIIAWASCHSCFLIDLCHSLLSHLSRPSNEFSTRFETFGEHMLTLLALPTARHTAVLHLHPIIYSLSMLVFSWTQQRSVAQRQFCREQYSKRRKQIYHVLASVS